MIFGFASYTYHSSIWIYVRMLQWAFQKSVTFSKFVLLSLLLLTFLAASFSQMRAMQLQTYIYSYSYFVHYIYKISKQRVRNVNCCHCPCAINFHTQFYIFLSGMFPLKLHKCIFYLVILCDCYVWCYMHLRFCVFGNKGGICELRFNHWDLSIRCASQWLVVWILLWSKVSSAIIAI